LGHVKTNPPRDPNACTAIKETGGSIGIWHFFPTLEKYVEGLKEMTDVVGVDHVSVGTDASGAPGLFSQYDRFTALVATMQRGGFSPATPRRSSAATT